MAGDMNPPLVIIGAGGHGRVILAAARAAGAEIAGLLDNRATPGSQVDSAIILGSDGLLDDPQFVNAHRFIIGIGDRAVAARLAARLDAVFAALSVVRHPAASVDPLAHVAPGSFIAAGAVVVTGASVQRHAIINTAASVDHDCQIAEGAHIAPGAVLCGGVQVGQYALIGAGAVAPPGAIIKPGQFVRANSLVGNNN